MFLVVNPTMIGVSRGAIIENKNLNCRYFKKLLADPWLRLCKSEGLN